MTRPAAFFFDLDGTLVDTETAWAKAIVDLVVMHGGRTTLGEILPAVVGRNWLDIDAALHERFPELGDSTPMQDAIELRKYYNKHAGDPRAMRIESSIAFYRKAAMRAPCAIVSGSPHDDVARAAALCGIAELTKLILGAGDYAAGKPSPSGYLRAAELLGVDPADCVVVEDSTVGVAAGVAAGMRVLALDRSAAVKQSFTGETWRVKDLSEFDLDRAFGAAEAAS